MATIALEGMRFYAYHGFHEEEQILGAEYVVDVRITNIITRAAVDDDLHQTINYETVHLICEAVMRKPSKLLETVAERIKLGLKNQFPKMQELHVRVKKLNPPMPGRVDAAWVEVDGQFTKKCARCDRPMLCYQDNSCWCMDTQMFEKTLEQVKVHYGSKCLCKECLMFYAN